MNKYMSKGITTLLILKTLTGCGPNKADIERIAFLNREKAKIGIMMDSLGKTRLEFKKRIAASDSTFWAIAAQADRDSARYYSGKATPEEKASISARGQIYYPYAMREQIWKSIALGNEIDKIDITTAKLDGKIDSINKITPGKK